MMGSSEPQAVTIDDEAAAFLARVLKLGRFFPGFDARRMRAEFPESSLRQYSRDSRIVEQGDQGRDLFVVYSGKVAIHEKLGGEPIAIVELEPGAIFGEVALMRGAVRTATATATEGSSVFRLAHRDMQSLMAKDPELAAHLDALAAERVGKPK